MVTHKLKVSYLYFYDGLRNIFKLFDNAKLMVWVKVTYIYNISKNVVYKHSLTFIMVKRVFLKFLGYARNGTSGKKNQILTPLYNGFSFNFTIKKWSQNCIRLIDA